MSIFERKSPEKKENQQWTPEGLVKIFGMSFHFSQGNIPCQKYLLENIVLDNPEKRFNFSGEDLKRLKKKMIDSVVEHAENLIGIGAHLEKSREDLVKEATKRVADLFEIFGQGQNNLNVYSHKRKVELARGVLEAWIWQDFKFMTRYDGRWGGERRQKEKNSFLVDYIFLKLKPAPKEFAEMFTLVEAILRAHYSSASRLWISDEHHKYLMGMLGKYNKFHPERKVDFQTWLLKQD